MKQYRLYVTDQKILGIVKQEKKSESTLANVYLKTLADGKAVVFFCGKEYEFDTKSTDGELSNIDVYKRQDHNCHCIYSKSVQIQQKRYGCDRSKIRYNGRV